MEKIEDFIKQSCDKYKDITDIASQTWNKTPFSTFADEFYEYFKSLGNNLLLLEPSSKTQQLTILDLEKYASDLSYNFKCEQLGSSWWHALYWGYDFALEDVIKAGK